MDMTLDDGRRLGFNSCNQTCTLANGNMGRCFGTKRCLGVTTGGGGTSTGTGQITGHFTCDNSYSIWVGNATHVIDLKLNATNSLASEIRHGEDLPPFDAVPECYLYVVAWSDDKDYQGWIGSFTGAITIHSEDPRWSVLPTGIDKDNNQFPTMTEINNAMASASPGDWKHTTVGAANGGPPWNFGITGIPSDAHWIWYDSGNDNRAIYPQSPYVPFTVPHQGFNHDEFLIFRIPCQEFFGDCACYNTTTLPPFNGSVSCDQTCTLVSSGTVGTCWRPAECPEGCDCLTLQEAHDKNYSERCSNRTCNIINRTKTFGVCTNDNFSVSEDSKPLATPSSQVSNWISHNYANASQLNHPQIGDCDSTNDNQYWAHTFTNLTTPGCTIKSATLEIRIKNGHYNDDIVIGFNNLTQSWYFISRLTTLGIPVGNSETLIIDLSNVSGTNLLGVIMSNGFLDVAVEDDSPVDYAILNITESCEKWCWRNTSVVPQNCPGDCHCYITPPQDYNVDCHQSCEFSPGVQGKCYSHSQPQNCIGNCTCMTQAAANASGFTELCDSTINCPFPTGGGDLGKCWKNTTHPACPAGCTCLPRQSQANYSFCNNRVTPCNLSNGPGLCFNTSCPAECKCYTHEEAIKLQNYISCNKSCLLSNGMTGECWKPNSCHCGEWNNITVKWWGSTSPTPTGIWSGTCGGSVSVKHNETGHGLSVLFGQSMNCINCPSSQPTYYWNITGPGGFSFSGGGPYITPQSSFNPPSVGTYQMVLTAECNGIICQPCRLQINCYNSSDIGAQNRGSFAVSGKSST